jgi:hypothetical protein
VSGDYRVLAGRDGLRWFIDQGWKDDEILEQLSAGPYPGDDGEILRAGTLRGRRRIKSILDELRGNATAAGCSPQLREVESAYRRSGGRPSEGQVAAAMPADPSTVRRYLRAAGIPSWQAMHVHMAEHHTS